jgi:hypothetical protein
MTKVLPSYCRSYSTEISWLPLTHHSLVLAPFSSYTIINSRPIKLCNRGRLHEVSHLDACPTATRNAPSTKIRTSPVHNFYDNHSKNGSSWIVWPLKMVLIGCPETSVRRYQSTLCKNPKERGSHLQRRRSLKSRILILKMSFLYKQNEIVTKKPIRVL